MAYYMMNRDEFLQLANTYRVVANEYMEHIKLMFERQHQFDTMEVLVKGDPKLIARYFNDFEMKYNTEREAYLTLTGYQICDGYVTTNTRSQFYYDKHDGVRNLADIVDDILWDTFKMLLSNRSELEKRVYSGAVASEYDCAQFEAAKHESYRTISERLRAVIKEMSNEIKNINACLESRRANSDILLDAMDAWNKYIA